MATTLVESLAAGDPEAFAALYDRLAGRLLTAARTMTGSAADAEDVVQDLFVDLARGRARLAVVVDLEAYVFTMLRNAVHRRGRRAAIVTHARAAGIDLPMPDGRLAPLVATARDVNRAPPPAADDLLTGRRREIMRHKTLLEELL